mmetsp:Transcript_22091/g.44312  ORF Transcript_22091/g.44312 Transcript_22091/m.44312 type:complete len:462 (-) Transcript_22091:372-1757(-)|eukprot:CAMPEP_0167833918 /NCGR_PEP_ID=MMETSP0112_2-20121227/15321_1 /TAXON_ID=91324 /ORGANISM="Lotharella globosa, Strain CCCM811" /LENGTH=461 /DNA_ID=CAMNT_0007739455 /DNA_START=55 /DNA_END=1440 /DNA_ORIENTATION=-
MPSNFNSGSKSGSRGASKVAEAERKCKLAERKLVAVMKQHALQVQMLTGKLQELKEKHEAKVKEVKAASDEQGIPKIFIQFWDSSVFSAVFSQLVAKETELQNFQKDLEETRKQVADLISEKMDLETENTKLKDLLAKAQDEAKKAVANATAEAKAVAEAEESEEAQAATTADANEAKATNALAEAKVAIEAKEAEVAKVLAEAKAAIDLKEVERAKALSEAKAAIVAKESAEAKLAALTVERDALKETVKVFQDQKKVEVVDSKTIKTRDVAGNEGERIEVEGEEEIKSTTCEAAEVDPTKVEHPKGDTNVSVERKNLEGKSATKESVQKETADKENLEKERAERRTNGMINEMRELHVKLDKAEQKIANISFELETAQNEQAGIREANEKLEEANRKLKSDLKTMKTKRSRLAIRKKPSSEKKGSSSEVNLLKSMVKSLKIDLQRERKRSKRLADRLKR